ncbi:MAG: NAD(P)H-hydrate dehydratase [Eubacteriales bacterium]|nr:NAD(P)H-hydrate dehydratase [Eubacteriales bacterium]
MEAFYSWLVDAEEMRRFDRNTTEHFGISSAVLMERAALFCLSVLKRRQERLEREAGALLFHPGRRVLVMAGTGNNGGDGLALGRLLSQEGFCVDYYLAGPRERCTPLAELQLKTVRAYGGRVSDTIPAGEYDIIVDALFGVGLSRSLTGVYAQAVSYINESPAFVLSLDLPSGISADTGQVMGTAVNADVTVTFGFWKKGLVLYPGARYAGTVLCAPIGITEDSFLGQRPAAFTLRCPAAELLPARPAEGNKGTFGKIMLLAGSEGMAGAALLCGRSAFAAGCGMVKLISPASNREILQQGLPEAMTGIEIEEGEDWADAIGAGPGLSRSPQALCQLSRLLEHTGKPLVLDADAINLLADNRELLERLEQAQARTESRRSLILTPHPGELSRLAGCSLQKVQEAPEKIVLAWAKRLQAAVLCKGARSVVASPEGQLYYNTSGNSGMATAGSGDVLTGIVTALLAVAEDPFRALCTGVYLHGLAGDLAAHKKGEYSMTAGDIAAAVPEILARTEGFKKE